MEEETQEWMRVYSEDDIIEYDEYSYYQDGSNVEIDVNVNPENLVEFTESAECEDAQFEEFDSEHYYIEEENDYSSSNLPDCELNSIIEVDDDAEEAIILQRENASEEDQEDLQKKLRTLQLKWFIQRENNRLKKKLMTCRICRTTPRFLNMEISMLQAEKQKLLKETNILRLTKEKLINEVTSIQSNLGTE